MESAENTSGEDKPERISPWMHTLKFKKRAWFGTSDSMRRLVGLSRELVKERIDQTESAQTAEQRSAISTSFDRKWDLDGRASLQIGFSLRPKVKLDDTVDVALGALDDDVGRFGFAVFSFGNSDRGNRVQLIFSRLSGVEVVLVGPAPWVATSKARLDLELGRASPRWSWVFSGWAFWASTMMLTAALLVAAAVSSVATPLVMGLIAVLAPTVAATQLAVPQFELLGAGRRPIAVTYYKYVGGLLGSLAVAALAGRLFG